jgi:hypothetical protein
MDWVEERIEAYRDGEDATWMERRSLEHANPVHMPLAVIGAVISGTGSGCTTGAGSVAVSG